jgi:diguanylate cyclase (GGDEF)-like protein
MKITHSDDLQDYLDNVQKLVKGKIRDFSLNKRYHRKDGSTIWLNLTVSPMWNIGEQPKYLILVAEDITARKLSEEKLELLSTTDQLTGVYNRRAFDEFFTRERDRAVRYNKPLSLILFDIDYFKKVNDTFGHEAGDHVLQEVVNISKEQIRKVDSLFRWGGEEFILLLPETEVDGAIIVAERLRSAVEKWEFPTTSSITISLGVSQFHKDDSDKTLIKRADVALYEAKQGGRNRVVISRFSESGII